MASPPQSVYTSLPPPSLLPSKPVTSYLDLKSPLTQSLPSLSPGMATALLVIDMQSIFTPMTTRALPNILTLITYFQRTSRPLIFTQHGHTKEELTPTFHNQLVRKWGPNNSIAIGSADWALQPAIAEAVKKGAYPVVGKNTYDGFMNTELEAMLLQKKVERVVVCGVMTDCCCDTTARSAFNRGFETWLVGDACGSASEEQHQAGLKAFEYAFGPVVATEWVKSELEES
ncbi:MAG: hypothetical protein Q9195_006768 [Heterodermia aff. obscurata]